MRKFAEGIESYASIQARVRTPINQRFAPGAKRSMGAGKLYFNMDEYHEYRKVIPIKQDEEVVRIAA